MRARNHVTADEWRRRLDECMAMVLAEPARFDEATVIWARCRREWLAEQPAAPAKPARPSTAPQWSLLQPEDKT